VACAQKEIGTSAETTARKLLQLFATFLLSCLAPDNFKRGQAACATHQEKSLLFEKHELL
jgi:hypothetical protein